MLGTRRKKEQGGSGSAGTREQPLDCGNLSGAQQLLTAFPESCWRRAQAGLGAHPPPLGRQQELGMCWRGFRAAAHLYSAHLLHLLMLPGLVQPWKPCESTQKGLFLGDKVIVIMGEEAEVPGQPRDADMQPSDKGEDTRYLAGRLKIKNLVSVTGRWGIMLLRNSSLGSA